MKFFTKIGLISFLFLSSCIKNNPDPSWIKIEKWVLNENLDVEEGELTENFSDVYITIDDKIIGIFELPVKLPILDEGSHKISLYPVIRNNGISATKKIYPFCEPHILTLNLVKNETQTIVPQTRYYDGTSFWIEDFENTVFNIDDDGNFSLAKLVKGNDPAILKYGNYYGHVPLTAADSIWHGETTPNMFLPKSAAEVYLEIDYITTNTVLTGLYAISDTGVKDNPNIQLNPQDETDLEWRKIYIDLKELVSSSISATSFSHYFLAMLDAGKTSSNIYLDNIKVVHF
ncbi:MAG: hypothetical protein K0R65_1610 [Crocinitomicaceae bacterium]|jgi:hypothetical protein|nr:hypothetical protein [Crocinitomicaceae bacterium]